MHFGFDDVVLPVQASSMSSSPLLFVSAEMLRVLSEATRTSTLSTEVSRMPMEESGSSTEASGMPMEALENRGDEKLWPRDVDLKIVPEFPKRLECPVCLTILRDPIQVSMEFILCIIA